EKENVDKLAALAAKDPAELHKKAAEYAKNVDDLGDVMNLLKKRTKDGGGVGVGPQPTGKPDDGIEARIQNYGKKAPSKEQLTKDKDALLQMVDRTTAVAEIALGKT